MAITPVPDSLSTGPTAKGTGHPCQDHRHRPWQMPLCLTARPWGPTVLAFVLTLQGFATGQANDLAHRPRMEAHPMIRRMMCSGEKHIARWGGGVPGILIMVSAACVQYCCSMFGFLGIRWPCCVGVGIVIVVTVGFASRHCLCVIGFAMHGYGHTHLPGFHDGCIQHSCEGDCMCNVIASMCSWPWY